MKMSTTAWSQLNAKQFSNLDLLEACYAKGMMQQSSAGFWQLDLFGARLKRHLEHRLHALMQRLGASNVELSLLQDGDLWSTTGRSSVYGQELYTLKDRRQRTMHLAATAEEAMCVAIKKHHDASGHKSMWAYQIGTKWRDETRARGGLARAREFSMLDAYSFGQTHEEIRAWHDQTLTAFQEFVNQLGLTTRIKEADCGEIGGIRSHEMVCHSQALGDHDGMLELAHLFELGTKYTQAFNIVDNEGQAYQMGCQGLGLSRLMMALWEHRRTQSGFYGDEHACSYLAWICSLNQDDERVMHVASDLENVGSNDAMWDDRELQNGRKLMDADGCLAAWRLVVSKRGLDNHQIEWRNGKGDTGESLSIDESKNRLRALRTKHWLDAR